MVRHTLIGKYNKKKWKALLISKNIKKIKKQYDNKCIERKANSEKLAKE